MTTYVPVPEGQDVADFLGRGSDNTFVALAGEHVVITTAAARMVSNPEGHRNESIGSLSLSRTVFNGWSLAETFILNRYRRRAR